MVNLGLVLLALVTAGAAQDVSRRDLAGITIIDTVNRPMAGRTDFENLGPNVGQILNVHYFPGMQDYANGSYAYAETQMSYVINNAQYIEANPRYAEFLSTAHYIRGMIYLYHANGVGRHRLANTDFEAAIKLNPQNYVAYLELSRVYSQLGLRDTAISVIRSLLELKPEQSIAEEGRGELKKLGVDPAK